MQIFELHQWLIFEYEENLTFLTTVQPESFHQHLGVGFFIVADSTSTEILHALWNKLRSAVNRR